MAKSLFIFLFFSFILDLLHRRKCRKVSCHKCYMVTITWQEVTASHHMMSHDKSHDRHGKVVHRPCNSCISSVEKSNENSIEFSLSNADKGAVGLIPALELASLTNRYKVYLACLLFNFCAFIKCSRFLWSVQISIFSTAPSKKCLHASRHLTTANISLL